MNNEKIAKLLAENQSRPMTSDEGASKPNSHGVGV